MANTNEVSFKAFLINDNNDKPEIRRFSVDQDVATVFLYLKEKLRSIFSSKLTPEFDIFWKDSEGDEITIDTDKELLIALTETKDGVLKIFIKNRKESGGAAKGVPHEGVYCDECSKTIAGHRYKCLACQDYDLCAECEAKGKHNEHFVLRIPTPLNRAHQFGHRFIHKLAKATKRAESRCPWSHRPGSRGNNHQFENLEEQFTNNCTTEENKASGGGGCTRESFRRHSKHHGEHGRHGGAQTRAEASSTSFTAAGFVPPVTPITIDPTAIINTLADFGLNVLFPQQQGQQPPTNQQSTPTQPQQPTTNQQTRPTQTQQPTSNQSQTIPNQPQPSAPNQPPTPNQQATPTQQSGTSQPQPNTSVPNQAQTTQTEASAPTQNNQELIEDAMVQTVQDFMDGWTVYNGNENETTTKTTPIIEMDLCSVSSASSVGDNSNQPSAPVSNPNQASTSAAATSADATSAASATSNLYPTLHMPKNDKVVCAVRQMMAMGFNNDDGWLTNLLNLQDGNVAKVLDLIHPKK